MEFKQLNLDSLPINPLTDTNSLDYKNQLNLAFNTNQALFNVDEYLSLLDKKIQQQPNTVKTLNLVLESYLYILLSTTTISNLDSSSLSSFYSKKKRVDTEYFHSPDSNYLSNLNYTNYKVWGTTFGSLGYYLYLAKSDLHYSNPSNLVRQSILELINRLDLPSYSTKLIQLINSERVEDDYQLYLQSISIIRELDLFKVVDLLDFYQTWLPEVLLWYSSVLSQNKVNPYNNDTSANKAFSLLLNIAQSLVRLGLYTESFTNLSYRFLHQNLDVVVLEGLQSVVDLKRANEFDITSNLTLEEQLLIKLFTRVDSSITSEFITLESYRLLSINLVGGLNLWYVGLAAELINRAYILTYSQYSNSSIYPIQKDESLLKLIERVYKLIFYAGYCLKKTNLNHLQVIGANLRVLSQLDDDVTIEEFDLLT